MKEFKEILKHNPVSIICGIVGFICIIYFTIKGEIISSCLSILITYNCANNIKWNYNDRNIDKITSQILETQELLGELINAIYKSMNKNNKEDNK